MRHLHIEKHILINSQVNGIFYQIIYNVYIVLYFTCIKINT